MILTLAAGADARATTRYVVPGGLGPVPCAAANPCALASAITVAATDDTVQLGEGTYNLGGSPVSINKRITIAGDPAVAAPTVNSSAAAAVNMTAAGAGTTLKHLRVNNTAFDSVGISASAAIKLYDIGVGVGRGECMSVNGTATVQDTTMSQSLAGNSPCLVVTGTAGLLRSTINASKATVGTTSVLLSGVGSIVDQSSITAGGAGLSLPRGTIRRTSIVAVTSAVGMSGTVTDSLLRATGAGGVALRLNQGDTTIARGVTVIATGSSSTGIKATAATFGGTTGAQLDGKNLIVRGTSMDIVGEDGSFCQPAPPCASGLGTVTYSNITKSSATTITTGVGMQSADPRFVSPSDFRLRTGSPAIDTGTADAKNGTRDLNGLLRPQNSKFDMGAYEYPKLQFPLNPGEIPPLVDPGPDPGNPNDPGNPGDPAIPSNPNGPGADKTAPTLSSFSLLRKRFRASGKRTATSARRTQAGTAVRFTVSEPAKISVAVLRPASGRKSGSACVKATSKPTKAKRCTRYTTVVTLTRNTTKAGRVSVRYSGKTKGRTLKPGAYRFSVTARDVTGNVSKPRTASFAVTRR